MISPTWAEAVGTSQMLVVVAGKGAVCVTFIIRSFFGIQPPLAGLVNFGRWFVFG
jgi:hypothetical protein